MAGVSSIQMKFYNGEWSGYSNYSYGDYANYIGQVGHSPAYAICFKIGVSVDSTDATYNLAVKLRYILDQYGWPTSDNYVRAYWNTTDYSVNPSTTTTPPGTRLFTDTIGTSVGSTKDKDVTISGISTSNTTIYLLLYQYNFGRGGMRAEPTYSSGTKKYTACSAPTTISLSATTAKPSTNVTLSWSGAKAGTGLSIASYTVYRSTSSGGTYSVLTTVTTSSTSGSCTVTSNSSRGSYYYYKVVTNGNVSGYSSGYSSASSGLYTNKLPTAPSMNKSTQTILSGAGAVSVTISVGTNTDSGQGQTITYTTNGGSTWSIYSSAVSINPSAGSSVTLTARVSDGYEYSSNTSITITRNLKPAFNAGPSCTTTTQKTFAGTNYNSVIGTLTFTPNKSVSSWSLVMEYGNTSSSLGSSEPIKSGSTVSGAQSIAINYDLIAKIVKATNKPIYYKLKCTISDGLESETTYLSSGSVTGPISGTQVATALHNDHASSDKAPSGYFDRKIRLQFTKDTAFPQYTVKYGTSSSSITSSLGNFNATASGNDYYIDITMPEPVTTGSTYYFSVTPTNYSKVISSSTVWAKTQIKKPVPSNILFNPESGLNPFNWPAGSTDSSPDGFAIKFYCPWETTTTSIQNQYGFTSLPSYVVTAQTTTSNAFEIYSDSSVKTWQGAKKQDSANTWWQFPLKNSTGTAGANDLLIALRNLYSSRNTDQNITITHKVTNAFGYTYTAEYTWKILWNQPFGNATGSFKYNGVNVTADGSNWYAQQGAPITFTISVDTCNPLATMSCQIYAAYKDYTDSSSTYNWQLIPGIGTVTIPTSSSEPTYGNQVSRSKSVSFTINTNEDKKVYFKYIVSSSQKDDKVVYLGAANQTSPGKYIRILRRLTPQITISSVSTSGNTYTVNYSGYNNGTSIADSALTVTSHYDYYGVAPGETTAAWHTMPDSTGAPDDSETDNFHWDETDSYMLVRKTISVTLYSGVDAEHIYPPRDSTMPTAATLVYTTPEYKIWNVQPTVSYRKNRIGINIGSITSNNSSTEVYKDGILIIAGSNSRNMIYLSDGQVKGKMIYPSNDAIQALSIDEYKEYIHCDSFLIDGGTWSS